MSFDCPSYCFENSFLAVLSRFGLVKGHHCSDDNPKQSLLHCFSEFRPVSDVEMILNESHAHGGQSFDEISRIYSQGLELEYGLQMHLITSESCPNVGLLSVLSFALNLDIYVVCGLLPMRFLRMDGNAGEYDVLRFKFYRNAAPTKVLVGVVGMGIFHKMEQPCEDSSIWDALLRKAIIVDNETLIINEYHSDSDFEDERGLEDDLVINLEPNLEAETISLEAINQTIEVVPRISMQEFVRRYLKYDDNGPSLDPEAYNFPEKIDVGLTSTEDFEGQRLTRLEQIVDIDGFFGVFEWKDSSVFKGNVQMCRAPKMASPREVNGFKKLLHDSKNNSEHKGFFFKLAKCTTNFGIIDMFFACFCGREDGQDVTEESIKAIVGRAFEYGLSAKCRNNETGSLTHVGCTAHRYRENSDAYRSVEKGHSEPIFDRSRYQCFTYHFGRAVMQGLSQASIRLWHDLCLVQAVGMKFVMISQNINGVMHSVSEIGDIFDLNRMHSSFDLCFSTVGHCSDPDKSVNNII